MLARDGVSAWPRSASEASQTFDIVVPDDSSVHLCVSHTTAFGGANSVPGLSSMRCWWGIVIQKIRTARRGLPDAEPEVHRTTARRQGKLEGDCLLVSYPQSYVARRLTRCRSSLQSLRSRTLPLPTYVSLCSFTISLMRLLAPLCLFVSRSKVENGRSRSKVLQIHHLPLRRRCRPLQRNQRLSTTPCSSTFGGRRARRR